MLGHEETHTNSSIKYFQCSGPPAVRVLLLLVTITATAWTVGAATTIAQQGVAPTKGLSEEIITLERSALDRWITGDPDGYLNLYASEITYFDPMREARVDGLKTMRALFEPIKKAKSPVKDPRYEMINPKVERHGDLALLTFNLISYGKMGDQPEAVLARWNSTEIYARVDGTWKIIHSHWSFTKPELKLPGS